MIKKEYMAPETQVVELQMQQMIAASISATLDGDDLDIGFGGEDPGLPPGVSMPELPWEQSPIGGMGFPF